MHAKKETGLRTAILCAAIITTLTLWGCSESPTEGSTGAPTGKSTLSPSSKGAFHPDEIGSVGCEAARPASTTAPAPNPANDLIIGPLVYPGLADGYNHGSVPYIDADGIAHFKQGTELPADTRVTVSIGASARTWAGILTEAGPASGYSSVTYQGCSSAAQPGRVFWVGGFTLGGKTTACVPLEVLVAGENQPHHVMLSLEAGTCS
ncbi:hypothetical protein PV772_19690 [Pseudarthrobacter sp. CC12]|uniref:hypothetical protein n=1 Tax=unclassified Pseudarthrobacter TaxID=2647000 RepID=UPI001057FB6D|nr:MULTISPECIES: hypothetical protein [unclassified Pseudarthrobacter]QDG62995.1 hypothetical protein NIBR502771_12105 [Pseudarthrobacter sp. NIBRBAC000502771]